MPFIKLKFFAFFSSLAEKYSLLNKQQELQKWQWQVTAIQITVSKRVQWQNLVVEAETQMPTITET